MKKALTLITLLLVAVTGMAQREGGSAPSIKKNKVMEALISDACRRGMSNDGTYCIDNSKNKVVDVATAEKYLRAKGYFVSGSSSKDYMRFGEVEKILDKVSFLDPNNFHLFAFNRLKGNNNIQYNQLKNKGICIFQSKGGNYHDGIFKYLATIPVENVFQSPTLLICENVLWSGSTVNGLIDGAGVGFVQVDDVFCYFEGNFKCGFPVSETTVKTYTEKKIKWKYPVMEDSWKDLRKEDGKIVGERRIISKWSAFYANKKDCPIELQRAITEYARVTYNENARQIEEAFSKLLVLNNRPDLFINFRYYSVTNEFIDLYSSHSNLDTKGLLPKAREIQNEEFVRQTLEDYNDNQKKYEDLLYKYYISYDSYHKSSSFKWEKASADTARYGQALRIASKKALIEENSPFAEYYSKKINELKEKKEQVFSNVRKQTDILFTIQREEGQYRREKCKKCNIVASKTVLPKGYEEEGLFNAARSETEGKIELESGDVVTWKYIFSGSHEGKIEARDWNFYTEYYDSPKEMMTRIEDKCRYQWCK